jgi:hypothetical protein
MRSIAAALLITVGANVLHADDLDQDMTPAIARMTGEINAAVALCGFKLRESERIFTLLPLIYHEQGRGDLLAQAAGASLAFQSKYRSDPVGACETARSRYSIAFD